jgi:hypothetical protein
MNNTKWSTINQKPLKRGKLTAKKYRKNFKRFRKLSEKSQKLRLEIFPATKRKLTKTDKKSRIFLKKIRN